MKIKTLVLLSSLFFSFPLFADTIVKYAGISKNIMQMALKADPKSQAWVRSARSILAVTDETVAQTVTAMNVLAQQSGTPLLCPPVSTKIDGPAIHKLLQDKVAHLDSGDRRTISEVVIEGLKKRYPCKLSSASRYGFMNQRVEMQSVSR